MKRTPLPIIFANMKSGITVGLVSVPLAISLAVASHATPTMGIITAFWACFIASIFGSSNYNVVGPAGALAGLLYTYANTFGVQSLPLLAIGAGFFILLGYLLRIEKYLIFIPGSALHGFILGVSITLILNQIPNALGLPSAPVHLGLIAKFFNTLTQLHYISLPTFLLFLGTFICLLVCAHYIRWLPGAIIVTPLGILIGYLSKEKIFPYTIYTLSSKYPSLSPALFQPPAGNWHVVYIFPCFVIAIVATLETLISAKIADGITKTKHNKHQELVGLGLANIITGLCGGIPVTAVLARTAINIKSGCTHKVSATIASIIACIISSFCLPLFIYLPLATIAAILVFVAGRLLEAERLLHLFIYDKKAFMLALIVAGVSIYEDPLVGILLGAVISMLIFMDHLSGGHHEIIRLPASWQQQRRLLVSSSDTLVYAIKGPLVYINAQAHLARLEQEIKAYKHLILDLQEVYFIDMDGIETLSNITALCQSKKITIKLTYSNSFIRPFITQHAILKNVLEE